MRAETSIGRIVVEVVEKAFRGGFSSARDNPKMDVETAWREFASLWEEKTAFLASWDAEDERKET